MSGNPRRSRPHAGRPAAETAWQHVARWYDGWVGQYGSAYHRAVAVPVALDLLRPAPRERILDVGAGQGVLAPAIAATGATYVGVDASPQLVEAARRRHGRDGRFVLGDARRLWDAPELTAGSFDAAVFLLSIQDMDPLEAIFDAIDWALRPDARVVIVMTHPAFRQPRHSGWGFDPGRGLTYRRVDAYLTEMAVPRQPVAGAPALRSFHRPIGAYVNGLAAVGLAVDAFLESPDLTADQRPRPARQRPASRPTKGSSRSLDRANAEIPLLLAIRARRARRG